jgi:hypothetical protein
MKKYSMPKEKQLPDHADNPPFLLSIELPLDCCEELKEKYKFKKEFNLYESLNEAFQSYDREKEAFDKGKAREQMILFNSLAERCKATVECIDHLGQKEKTKIIEKYGAGLNFDDLRFQLDIVAVHSSSIAHELKPYIPKGKPPEPCYQCT